MTALYTACGDVRNVVLGGDTLVVYIEDEYLYNIISSERNLAVLQELTSEIDDVAALSVQYSKKEDYVEKDIATLKKKFGSELKIK